MLDSLAPQLPEPSPVHRLTLFTNHRAGSEAASWLRSRGIHLLYQQSGRVVRRRVHKRRLLPGVLSRLDDSPSDVFTCILKPQDSPDLLAGLYQHLDLSIPGRGSLYLQHAKEYLPLDVPSAGALGPIAPAEPADRAPGRSAQSPQTPNTDAFQNPGPPGPGATAPGADKTGPARAAGRPDPVQHLPGSLGGLSLLTCILSMPGSGERLARVMLDLGTSVPLVTLGAGTGFRDRLGLLRITVPNDKEIVQVLIPEMDQEAVISQCVEIARLNRPGQGFLYAVPVYQALPDTRVQIGYQSRAASLDQIIATLDQLNGGTAWRRRVRSPGSEGLQIRGAGSEVSFICEEGKGSAFVQAAMSAGAPGATTARYSRLGPHSLLPGSRTSNAARERITMTVPSLSLPGILSQIWQAQHLTGIALESLQTIQAPASYTYQSGS
ncbi:hypothetical protein [Spirochaeta lutea]|uniref:Uncharacterized protein n=1 Tax=Spirochaeta lutea TaxID=1480694 RepID=A0A098QX94_9SPIO|nr:hypothetical protein [Spirochaeta lutea]KGE71107.1 hypothetical protein DC28_12715 [Spirochaeta lutea]